MQFSIAQGEFFRFNKNLTKKAKMSLDTLIPQSAKKLQLLQGKQSLNLSSKQSAQFADGVDFLTSL